MIRTEKLMEWCSGNTAAVAFLQQTWTAAQEWDDLEDEGACEDRNRLLSWLAFGKEFDPFYASFDHILRPVMLNMYLAWMAANALEAAPTEGRLEKSYVLRAQYYGLCHVCAFICGGHDHAARVAVSIWDEYGETLAGHKAEFLKG